MSQSFADLGISRELEAVLERRGARTPFPIQRMVVPDVLAGRDVLAQSPTGSGKTLAFVTPILDRLERGAPRPAALVLAPTRELAAQIVEQAQPLAKARGLTAMAVYGGVAIGPQLQRAGKSHLLVATPGRLLDLLDRRALSLDHARVVVLDEADRMLDMGFRPDVERILTRTPRARQTLLFSATLAGEVGQLARRYTSDARRHENRPAEGERPQIRHRFLPVAHERKVDELVGELRARDDGLALVFVRTRRGADRLVKRLGAKGVRAAAMHGGKSQGNRTRTLASFEGGGVDALVATDVAARGIDVRDISRVINFDPPADRDAYVHRVGRTARAGRSGVGVTFVMSDQAHEVSLIARDLDLHREFAAEGLRAPERQGRGQHPSASRSRRRRRR